MSEIGERCAIGDSCTGVSCFSSSGGVGSSGSVLSNEVSEAAESFLVSGRGSVGLVTTIPDGIAGSFAISGSMGAGESTNTGDALTPASELA